MNKHAKLLVDMPSDRRWRSFQELMLTINTRYDHGWFGWFRRWWKWEVNCLLRDLVEHRMVEQRWDSENQRMEFRVTDSGVMIQVSYWIAAAQLHAVHDHGDCQG